MTQNRSRRRQRSTGIPVRLTLVYTAVVAIVATGAMAIVLPLLSVELDRRARRDALNGVSALATVVKDAAERDHLTQLSTQLDTVIDALTAIEREARLSGRGLDATQAEAAALIREQRVGSRGYFYVIDDDILVVHREPDIEGTRASSYEEISDQLSRGAGFFRYDWQNPGDPEPLPKVAVVRRFDPWGWTIGASDYQANAVERVDGDTWRLVLDSVRAGDSLSAWLLDSDSGTLVARSARAGMPALDQLALFTRLRNPEQARGVIRLDRMFAGTPRYLAWETLADQRLRVAMLTEDARLGAIMALVIPIILSGLALLLVVLVLVSRRVARSISRPVERVVARFTDAQTDSTDLIGMLKLLLRAAVRLEYAARRRTDAEHEHELSEAVFQRTSEGILVTDRDGRIIRVNPAFTEITGYTPADAVGRFPSILKSDRHTPQYYTEMWDRLLTTGTWEGEIWNRRKSGEIYPELLAIQSLDVGSGGFVAVFHDISEIHQARTHLQYMATHDPLTRLPNRVYLTDMLDRLLPQNSRRRTTLAVVFIDLDNFKEVNDTLGHSAGDDLIRSVAAALQQAMRDEDIVARFGGDEFVVLISGIADQQALMTVLERIQSVLNVPYDIGEVTVDVSGSIGVATYPDGGTTAEELLKNADAAMYQAKDASRGTFQFHEERFNRTALMRTTAENRFRDAIEAGALEAHLLPIISNGHGRPMGAELLARWRDGGVLRPPSQFLPLIEGSGVMALLAEQMFGHAARILARHMDDLPDGFFLTVNLSAGELGSGQTTRMLVDTLQRVRVPVNRVYVEVSENAAFRDITRARREIMELKSAGVGVMLDNFGEGQATLRYLRDLGADVVKLDRTYTAEVVTSRRARSLMHGFVGLAQGVGLDTVVSGIEYADQLAIIEPLGATWVQGYHFGEPAPAEQIVPSIGERNRSSGIHP